MNDANDAAHSAAEAAAQADISAKPIPDSMGGAAELLDIEVVEMSEDRVVATMPVTPKHHQPFGVLHGGVSVVLAESVASIGAYLAAPDGYVAMGIEINANHIRAVRDGTVTAVATPVHRGRSTQVWQVEIKGANDKLVCVSRCTLAIVKKQND
nr:hotdog fold thioesterase [Longibacter salinarum]